MGLQLSPRGNPGEVWRASFGPLPALDVGLYSYHCGRARCIVMLRMQTLMFTPTQSSVLRRFGFPLGVFRACERASDESVFAHAVVVANQQLFGRPRPGSARSRRLSARGSSCNLVDPASSHMLVSKIKPCMSKYKLLYGETANGSLKQLSST